MGYLSSCKADSSILTSNSHYPTKKNKPPKQANIEEFLYSDLEAATNGFSEQKLLGKGSHGYVYKGVLQSGRLVAIKKPSRCSSVRLSQNSSSSDNTSEVDNEIHILSKIQSPGLVNLVGFSTDSIDRLLVVEFMSNGTLYDVLHSASRPPINWGRRIRLSLQTAKAIDTLHSSNPPVIHRDIKSANVLIDRNFNARLGDFGLALRCHVNNFRLRSTPPAGTIGYLDPGYVTPDNLSTKTDVFSFGILLLEIISGRKAIDIGYSPPSILDWAVPLVRKRNYLTIFDPRIPPPKDISVIKQLAVLAAKCVRSCRERRPSMKDVVESLGELSKMIPGHSWNSFSINNPCMMIEQVTQPVECGTNNTPLNTKPCHRGGGSWDLDRQGSTRSMRSSKRVHSNLGVESRNNLMDLMAGLDGNSKIRGGGNGVESASPGGARASSFRGGSGRQVGRGRSESQSYNRDDVFQLKRNQSVGGRVGVFLKPDRLARFTGADVCIKAIDSV